MLFLNCGGCVPPNASQRVCVGNLFLVECVWMSFFFLPQDDGGQRKRTAGNGSVRVGDPRVTPQSAVAVQTTASTSASSEADDVVDIIGGGDDDDEIIDLC